MNRSRLSDEIYLAWYLLTTSPFSHAPTEALEAIRKQWPDVNQDTTVKVVSIDISRLHTADHALQIIEESPVIPLRFVDIVFRAAYMPHANRLFVQEY